MSAGVWFGTALGLATLAGPAAGQTAMLVYPDGRVVVRQTQAASVPRGVSRQLVELDQLDAGSLMALDSGVTLRDIRYPAVLNEASLLRAAVGRRLLFRNGRDTVSALVLGVDPPRYEVAPGEIVLTAPGAPVFPPELAGQARRTAFLVESDRARDRLTLAYVTSGVRWQAEYAVQLAGGQAELSGRIALISQDVGADSVQISVVEGVVGRAGGFERDRSYARPDRELELRGLAVMASATAPVVIGGYRVYPLTGRHSLAPGYTTVASLFPPTRVAVEHRYRVAAPGEAGYAAPAEDVPVEVRYRVARPAESDAGRLTLPAGIVRVFGRAPDGGPILVGEARLESLDPGKPLELVAGRAVALRARRLAGRLQQVQDTTFMASGRPGAISRGQVADHEFRLTNASDSAAVVEVRERLGEARLVWSSMAGDTSEPGILSFAVRVPPKGEAAVRFRLRLPP